MKNQKLIDKVNKIYDKQIAHKKFYEIDKKLFNYSLELTIGDWRNIRGPKFWQELDDIRNHEFLDKFKVHDEDKFLLEWWTEFLKKKFTLNAVEEYLKNNV